MRFLAWVYLMAPDRLTRLLPDKVKGAEEGRWAEAVYDSYNRWAARYNRRQRRKAARDVRRVRRLWLGMRRKP